MTDYPITLDEFKLYFLREAGLNYQPYPTFVQTVYNKDVYVTHNDSTWRSLVDNNVEEPAEGEYWVEVFNPLEKYPEWVAPIAYNKDERVVAIVNFKPGVWVSLQDNNYATPGTNAEMWELDEEDDLDGVVLDLDIERAMGEASFKFNKSLFTEPKGKMIFLYLTMFFLVYDKQMGASGLNGNSAAGPVIHRSVGKMSVSYMESKLYSKYPSYEFLSTNDYGRKAFNLMAPYLRAGVRILYGAASGE